MVRRLDVTSNSTTTTAPVRRDLATTPERAYDLIADPAAMGRWSPECTGGYWLAGARAAQPGARFVGTNRRRKPWRTTCTITTAQRGRELTWIVGAGEARWTYRFAPGPAGCTIEAEVALRTPDRTARRLLRWATGTGWSDRPAQLRADLATTLDRLAAEIAASNPSPDAPDLIGPAPATEAAPPTEPTPEELDPTPPIDPRPTYTPPRPFLSEPRPAPNRAWADVVAARRPPADES